MAGVVGDQPSKLAPPGINDATEAAVRPSAIKMPATQQGTDPLDSAIEQHMAAGPQGGAPAQQSAADPLDAAIEQHMNDKEQEHASLASRALHGAAKVLDYPGGLIRTGLSGAAGALGVPGQATPGDVINAFKGNAPRSADYLQRAGVDEGPSYMIPGLGHVTGRDVAGFALDVASDPLTAISKLAKEVPYIGKLINAPGAAAEWTGQAVYKNALSKVDSKLAEKGTAPVSDLLMQAGASGSPATLAAKAQEMAGEMGNFRQTLYDKAAEKGAYIDLASPKVTSRTDAVLAGMKADPGLAPAAEDLEHMLNRYKTNMAAPLSDVSAWKTSLYDALPATAFDGFGKAKSASMRFKTALSLDLKDAIVQAGNKAEKGLGDAIDATNSKWGTLIEANKPLNKMAAGGNSSIGHMIDGAMLGTGHLEGLAVKKAYDLANSTYLKTKVGLALSKAGQEGAANAVVNRAMINSQRGAGGQIPSALSPNPEEGEGGQ